MREGGKEGRVKEGEKERVGGSKGEREEVRERGREGRRE